MSESTKCNSISNLDKFVNMMSSGPTIHNKADKNDFNEEIRNTKNNLYLSQTHFVDNIILDGGENKSKIEANRCNFKDYAEINQKVPKLKMEQSIVRDLLEFTIDGEYFIKNKIDNDNCDVRNLYNPNSIETLTTTDSRESYPLNELNGTNTQYERIGDSPFTGFSYEHPGEFRSLEELINNNEDHDSTLRDSIFKGVSRLTLKMSVYMLIFIVTNSAQPLLICLLRKYGGTPTGTYTFLFPTYLAMICVGMYPTNKSIMQENWKYPIMLSTLDIIHQVVEKAGLMYCGPSIYSIASSTNTMFLALFSKIILKRKLTEVTWISIGLISGSLAINGIGEFEHITYMHIIGFSLVVFAALVNALNSVLGEDILKNNQIEGPNLVCMMGIISLTTFILWTLFWTVPQRDLLFKGTGNHNPFDFENVIKTLLTLFISNLGRSSVYYYIIKESGSISCGILKAIRIIIVVIGGHILFSSFDKTQTITPSKIVSSIICSVGVILYSLEKSNFSIDKE